MPRHCAGANRERVKWSPEEELRSKGVVGLGLLYPEDRILIWLFNV
jgi:hypothetical protein